MLLGMSIHNPLDSTLGDFLGSRQEGPGMKTLWRGMSKLHHLMEGAQLATKT